MLQRFNTGNDIDIKAYDGEKGKQKCHLFDIDDHRQNTKECLLS